MVILKKIRAATLVETLVSSVIIVIVFMIASMSLNNIFGSVVKGNDSVLRNRIKEVTYMTQHATLNIPFYEDTEQWEIVIERRQDDLVMEVHNKMTSEEKEIRLQYAKTR